MNDKQNKIQQEASRCLNCKIAKCQEFCPIHNNIPLFNKLTKENRLKEAYEAILVNSIFPDICGTICPHEKQCEGHCVKSFKNEGIKIGMIESYLGKWARKNYRFKKLKKNKYKVAAIGSGPASLAFALYLSRNGYQVDIYEKENYIGGVINWGIPPYRLNKSILNSYIKELKSLSVKFYLKSNINNQTKLNELINAYDYVFIGIGTTIPNKMNIKGEDNKHVYDSYSFLLNTNMKIKRLNYGKDIAVIGGGNVAIDAARNAIRLKNTKNVYLIYRRSENEMPANKEEIKLAKKEGIKILPLTNPKCIHKSKNLIDVECARMELGELDKSGRPTPKETNLPHIHIKVNSLISAIGYTSINLYKDLKVNEYNKIIVDEHNLTSIKNVYAGGDFVTGSKTVVLAMRAGLNAAKDIIDKTK